MRHTHAQASERTRFKYSKTCVKRRLLKDRNLGFQDQLSLNAGQKAFCNTFDLQ